ncbi:hypothetical protein Hdeb2414_s0017g00503821 [Helianthus debilis subsp. tardiflorus]
MSYNNQSQPPVNVPPQFILSYNNQSQPPMGAPPQLIMCYNNQSQPPLGAPPQLSMSYSYNNQSQPPVGAPPTKGYPPVQPQWGYPTVPVPDDAPKQQRDKREKRRGTLMSICCCW